MKPSFALNLSHDGISLLHRAQAGWLNVGDVSLDAPDLMDELVVLRRTAADLEAGGLTTKLVIPNSQILYVEVDAPGPSRADRVAQIRDALVGLTPYDLQDLVFDWRQKGKKAQVAVVARGTLTEAETFATQYRFNPVSFVATPKNGAFDGEPFFGPTRHAVRLLQGGETIEPDKRRIKVVGKLGDAVAEAAARQSAPLPEDSDFDAVATDGDEAERGHAPERQPPVARGESAAIDAPTSAEAAPRVAPSSQPNALDAVKRPLANAHVNGAELATVSGESTEVAEPAFARRRAAAPAVEPDAVSEPAPDAEKPAIAFSTRRQSPPPAKVNGHSIPETGKPRPVPTPASVAAAGGASVKPELKAVVEDLPPIVPRAAPEAPSTDGARLDRQESRPVVDRIPSAPGRDAGAIPPSPAARAAAVDSSAPELAKKPDPITGVAGVPPTPDAPKRGLGFRLLRGKDKAADRDPTAGTAGLANALARMRQSPMPQETVTPQRDIDPVPAAKASPPVAAAAPAKPAERKVRAKELPSRRASETGGSKPLARRAPSPAAPKLRPLPKVQIGNAVEAREGPVVPQPGRAPVRKDPPRPATATEADAMTVFGARGKTPPPVNPRFVGPAVTLALLLALAVVGLWSTYFLSDVARDWFGLGGEPEIAEVEEPAPVILPEAPAAVSDGPIAEIAEPDTAVVAPDLLPPEPVAPAPDAAAPDDVADTPVPPSVPLPGIEVTALQPESSQVPPAAPAAPAVDVVPGAPSAEAALPSVLAETDATPPELVAAAPPAEDAVADTVIAAAEPPAAPDVPPVVDVSPPVLDTAPPDPDAVVARPDPLDPGPGRDIATIAPRPPIVASDVPSEPASPAPVDNPGTIDIVRLQEPPQSGVYPDAEVEAPPPAVATRIAPPTAEEALAFYQRTGISVAPPPAIDSPGIDRLNEMVVSSADVALAEPRPRGLPTTETLDTAVPVLPRATFPPLPLTLEYDLDDRGFVRATDEGALTPLGVVVFRGQPAVVPPPRPGTPAPEDETRAPEEPAVLGEPESPAGATEVADTPEEPTGTVEEEFALVDPSVFRDEPLLNEADLAEADERARFGGRTLTELAGIRPTVRPGTDLAAVPEAGTETGGGAEVAQADTPDTPAPSETGGPEGGVTLAALNGGTDADSPQQEPDVVGRAGEPLIDLAGFVPPLRPGSASLLGNAAPEGETAADGDGAAAPDEEPPVFEDASELAVAASLTPSTRPAGFASIVQSALEEAAAAPAPPRVEEVAVAPPAAVPASVPVSAPEIPSSATVASAATEENALRLNRVNLIGVYGSAANRRALVRLSSGRYVKVQVGDTVDGGRVAAIGDDQLSYVKGGRTLTLSLPNG